MYKFHCNAEIDPCGVKVGCLAWSTTPAVYTRDAVCRSLWNPAVVSLWFSRVTSRLSVVAFRLFSSTIGFVPN
jgi:hypothetical protein